MPSADGVTSPASLPMQGRPGNLTRFPAPGLGAFASVLAVATVVGAVLAIRDTAIWGTTYAGASVEAAYADLAAGLGLIAAGSYVVADANRSRLGAVIILAGTAWLSADLVGWQGAWLHLRVVASAGALMLAPLLLHVVAIAPGEHAAGPRLGFVVAAAYATGLVLGVMTLLGRDPATDAGCWDLCSANPLLLVRVPDLSVVSFEAAVVFGVATGGAVAFVAALRLRRSSRAERREAMVILVPGLIVGLLTAGRWLAAGTGSQGPGDPTASLLFEATAWFTAALAGGLIIVVRGRRRMRSTIAALARVDSATGRVRSARGVLIEATGDPSLSLAYPRTETGRWIGANGEPVEPRHEEGRALTSVRRRGELVAVIEHEPMVIAAADLAELFGPAARLALENERLDAELLAQVRELRESRARIVAAADAERRRREGALHDGAQQRLLALTYDLRTAREACADAGLDGSSDATAQHLDAAIDAVHAAHQELREVAHGIYPAVLSEAGLAPALEGLVDRAPIPTRLEKGVTPRCGSGVEMTIYVAAHELVRDAHGRGARRAELRLHGSPDRLCLDVHDDGVAPDGTIDHVADRAGASGGTLILVDAIDGHVVQRVEVPCASS